MTVQVEKSVTGEIVSITIGQTTADKKFATVELLQPGRSYPIICRAFEPELVERFETLEKTRAGKNMAASLFIEEKLIIKNGKEITYRDIVGIDTIGDPPTGETSSEPHPVEQYESTSEAQGEAQAVQSESKWVKPPLPPEGRSTGLAVRYYRYSRTFNLGNFESEKFEIEEAAIPGWSDLAMFTLLKERIDAVRAQLPVDTSARQVVREQQNEL